MGHCSPRECQKLRGNGGASAPRKEPGCREKQGACVHAQKLERKQKGAKMEAGLVTVLLSLAENKEEIKSNRSLKRARKVCHQLREKENKFTREM